MKDAIINQLGQLGVIPIIVMRDVEDAVPVAEALVGAGLPTLEVTYRTAAAGQSLERIRGRFPELLLGAGTVLTLDQAKEARDCGAQFIISPGLDPKMVEYCLGNDLVPLPGVSSPTEIQTAVGLGLTALKLFPAELLGGIRYLESVVGPFPMVRFIPTGGVHTGNLETYLSRSEVLACAGTWIARKDWLQAKRFDLIERAAAHALEIVRGVRARSRS